MILPQSRYAQVATVVTTTQAAAGATSGKSGVPGPVPVAGPVQAGAATRTVVALKRRALPATPGEAHEVRDRDQLDVLAHEQYGDGTRFWHIADANTALEARELVAGTGSILLKPRS